MKLLIVSVGKKHSPEFLEALTEYEKRIQRVLPLEWRLIPPSSHSGDMARDIESTSILTTLKPNDVVWLLDERGEQISSLALASKIDVLKSNAASRLVIIIGGAYGVNDTVRNRATWVWSLSKLVFPHQLVRVLLTEQLYRATEIAKGSGYHHA